MSTPSSNQMTSPRKSKTFTSSGTDPLPPQPQTQTRSFAKGNVNCQTVNPNPRPTCSSKCVATWDDPDFNGNVSPSTSAAKPPRAPEKGQGQVHEPSSSLKSQLCFQKKKPEDSDNEFEEESTDNVLGRLRKGMQIISNHARQTMADCETEESRNDMQGRLESSTLKMLRAEKTFLNTTKIVAEVVEEFVDGGGKDKGKLELKDAQTTKTNTNGAGESDTEMERVIFRQEMMTSASMPEFREQMSKSFGEGLERFQNGLTEEVLRADLKFKGLLKQIRHGRKDSERFFSSPLDAGPGSRGDCEGDLEPDQLSSSSDENEVREADPDNEDYDDSILPTMDPITKEPIRIAVSLKACHHVFDMDSITSFILRTTKPRCPVLGCRNKTILQQDHVQYQERLTNQIRTKNHRLYGPVY